LGKTASQEKITKRKVEEASISTSSWFCAVRGAGKRLLGRSYFERTSLIG
jgi:hypothetical protein